MTIFFDPPYPHVAPRAFVTPTPNMKIKEGHRSLPSESFLSRLFATLVNNESETLMSVFLTRLFDQHDHKTTVKKVLHGESENMFPNLLPPATELAAEAL